MYGKLHSAYDSDFLALAKWRSVEVGQTRQNTSRLRTAQSAAIVAQARTDLDLHVDFDHIVSACT